MSIVLYVFYQPNNKRRMYKFDAHSHADIVNIVLPFNCQLGCNSHNLIRTWAQIFVQKTYRTYKCGNTILL